MKEPMGFATGWYVIALADELPLIRRRISSYSVIPSQPGIRRSLITTSKISRKISSMAPLAFARPRTSKPPRHWRRAIRMPP